MSNYSILSTHYVNIYLTFKINEVFIRYKLFIFYILISLIYKFRVLENKLILKKSICRKHRLVKKSLLLTFLNDLLWRFPKVLRNT